METRLIRWSAGGVADRAGAPNPPVDGSARRPRRGDPADFGVVRQRVAASQMAADVDEIAEPLANFVFRVR